MPVVLLAVVATALAYTLGIHGISRLRPSFASLVGLSEVLAAVVWAWLLVGEAISVTQAIGGAVVLAGLALARPRDDSAEAIWPDAAGLEGSSVTNETAHTRIDR